VGRDVAEILVHRGKLDARGAERAAALSRAEAQPVDAVLARLGLVSEADMTAALAEHLGRPLARAADFPRAPVLADRIGAAFLREHRVLPLADAPEALTVAMADPRDGFALSALGLLVGKPVQPWVAAPSEIEAAIDRLYARGAQFAAEPARRTSEAESLRDSAGDAPAVRAVNRIVEQAAAARASDIHLEPFESSTRLRLRVDGRLVDVEPPAPSLHAAIVARIKVLARLDVAERRLPQDGAARVSVRGRELDIRVSTAPAAHGEMVVMRLLDKREAPLNLDELGFSRPLREAIAAELARPDGMLLVTGPTGSGKTTTLYAALQLLNTADRKIISAEDPIEYQLDGINQIQAKPQIGLDFPRILRSALRQDPDVILVGEIRDLETARTAVQAALTGHLLLSTLHTNGAAAAVARLADIGVEEYLLSAALRGVLAQRLVRAVCRECAERYEPSPELRARLRLDGLLWRARGCASCGGSGYRGRTAVGEFLRVTEDFRRLILRRAGADELDSQARADGLVPILADGLAKAQAGETTLEELHRVLGEAA
jgi:general secretion pathway protein E